jgi:alpha-L-fucosidase 2
MLSSLISLLFLSLLPHTLAKSFWSPYPASAADILRTAYPVGNGRLGILSTGPAGAETLSLNVDSLWAGGPFEASNYTGGNPLTPVAPQALEDTRQWIFTNGTGNVSVLLGEDGTYGSYRVLGNLSVVMPSLAPNGSSGDIKNYTRKLDLETGIHSTRYRIEGVDFETNTFCSFPEQVCVYTVQSSQALPMLEVRLDNEFLNSTTQKATCGAGFVRLRGVTQVGPPEGMRYEAVARVVEGTRADTGCNAETGVLHIVPQNGTNSVTLVLGAGTDYDAKKGTAEFGYSFRGVDPAAAVEATTTAAAKKTLSALHESHEQDFAELIGRFTLFLSDPLQSAKMPTAELFSRFNASSPGGDPYLESLLFDYASYLFVSSSRPGSLPPNLQGRWSEGLSPPWSADYHSNINLQMNHWTPDQTGLTDLQTPLWTYMADTWAPRGHETAELLYGAPGWVVHNEMNIFGHTGMKSGAEWANYPAAAAWMMQHVFDAWDYTRDVEWLRTQAYPLIKGVAEFWVSQLQEDEFSGDGTLIVNPCNSPEHGQTTFGCVHFHQLIYQVFEAVLSVGETVSEESEFLEKISTTMKVLDKGFHIGDWGQIKEWKLPDSEGYEFINDTHRHLSELVGWHPGYALSSFMGGYSNATIQNAVEQKLYSRGIGNAKDGNAGWGKVWRAACWARLNNTEKAHFQLRYAIEQNFADNGFSTYDGSKTPFQIDANFGLGGAVLAMLIVDLPAAFGDDSTRTVVLGPAIPASWAGGSVKGMRLRGGGVLDFTWDDQGMVNSAKLVDRETPLRLVNKDGDDITGV